MHCSYLLPEIQEIKRTTQNAAHNWSATLIWNVTGSKGLFMWTWDTPGWWGNPPVHVIFHIVTQPIM